MTSLWKGIRAEARASLLQRDYGQLPLGERLATTGVEAAELFAAAAAAAATTAAPSPAERSARLLLLPAEVAAAWIPGVELLARRVYPQRHRGFFGELARREEGVLGRIGLWPRQWATATMFAGTAKGFHLHPPFVPEGEEPEKWFQRLYGNRDEELEKSVGLRPYEREQWDTMFFLQGSVEMLMVDERAGLERRVMRFFIEGDDRRGPNNAAVVIPAGVAHALRVEGSRDAIMVYGTSTVFAPAFEGRLAAEVESALLPPEWTEYLLKGGDAESQTPRSQEE